MKYQNHFVLFVLLSAIVACGIPPSPAESPTANPLPSTPYFPPSTSSPDSSEQADVIFTNAIIITMDDAHPTAEAVAILGDRIVAVGTNEDVLNYRGDNTIMINLEGRAVTPGFIDSHTHRITQRFKWEFSTVEEAALEALSQGWTGLTELAVDENQFNELREAAEQGNLRVRVNAYLTANTFSGETLPEWYNAYQPRQQFGPYLRIAGLKIFIDGNSGRTLYWEQNEWNSARRDMRLSAHRHQWILRSARQLHMLPIGRSLPPPNFPPIPHPTPSTVISKRSGIPGMMPKGGSKLTWVRCARFRPFA